MLIPEAVAVSQPFELVNQNRLEQFADAAFRQVIFGEAANPDVNVVDCRIRCGESSLCVYIGRDLGERGDRGQSVVDPSLVVIRQTVIAASPASATSV